MRRGMLTTVVVAAAVALTGCASVPDGALEAQAYTDETLNDPKIPVGPGSEMTVSTFEWGFEVLEGVAVDGPVEITLVNEGGAFHNFQIDAAAGENKVVEANAGEEGTGTLELFAGTYTYYCSVPGHRGQGMEGELTVYNSVEEAQEAATEGDMGA
ncbi:MAG: plastocyanin/azurin family copper-binding protein [Actinomycetes bacterium]